MSFPFDHLIHWFNLQKRILPWRGDPQPYAVWVSEIMLQQTQVSVVIPYFEKWMERFPTIHELAKADEAEVMKLWEGLGYYSRARYLLEGAKYVVENFGGVLPSDPAELSKIKGLGDYTIGAILSFAYHRRIPAVDGNVLRVISRYFGIEEDISKGKTVKMIREILQSILPEDESWIASEALIELGAVICQKKSKCSLCPLKQSCNAFATGRTETIPFKSNKYKVENLYRTVAILKFENHLLVRKVKKGEIMEGLHEFPYFETEAKGYSPENLLQGIEKLGLKASFIRELPTVKHSFTRYQAELYPALFLCDVKKEVEGYQWMNFDEIGRIPFSSGHRRILNFL